MEIRKFSQIGKRENNEDFLGFNENLITVCDGMGGHTCGERASKFVVESMLQKFEQPIEGLNEELIQQKLQEVQTEVNEILKTEPQLEKMGTTFTGIFRSLEAWYVAHIGDSRVYLYRPSEEKLWHTWDQSLVGQLMKYKDITREAGRFHPMSNRIDKAIIANSAGKTHTAEIAKFDQLQPGDIFMLCSDGVVEAWGDLELVNLFKDNSLSFDQKVEKLARQCNEKSRDNNTAIVLELGENDALAFGNNEGITWVPFKEIEDDYALYLQKQKEDEERAKMPPPPPPPHPLFGQQSQQVSQNQPVHDANGSQRPPQTPPANAGMQRPAMRNPNGGLSNNFWYMICGVLLVVIIALAILLARSCNAPKNDDRQIKNTEKVGVKRLKQDDNTGKSSTTKGGNTDASQNGGTEVDENISKEITDGAPPHTIGSNELKKKDTDSLQWPL